MVTLPRCLEIFSAVLQKENRLVLVPPEDFQRAAVLIPLIYRNSEWFLLFTRRAENVRHHPGQISFPGGRVDESDENIVYTALRETHEELGIEEVEILGCIDDIVTISQYIVTPVVGVVNEDRVSPNNINRSEIDYVLEAPLSHLSNPDFFSLKTREWREMTFEVPFFDYNGEIIWGATGRILVDLLNKLCLLNTDCQVELFEKNQWKIQELPIKDLETLKEFGFIH